MLDTTLTFFKIEPVVLRVPKKNSTNIKNTIYLKRNKKIRKNQCKKTSPIVRKTKIVKSCKKIFSGTFLDFLIFEFFRLNL